MTMFAFVAFTIVREHEGQIPVQRYVALVHAQATCLRCVCVVLEALLAWRGVEWRSCSVAFLLVPSPYRFLSLGSPPPSRFFFSLFRGFVYFTPLGFWPQCDGCYSGGLGAGGSWLGCGVVRLWVFFRLGV